MFDKSLYENGNEYEISCDWVVMFIYGKLGVLHAWIRRLNACWTSLFKSLILMENKNDGEEKVNCILLWGQISYGLGRVKIS